MRIVSVRALRSRRRAWHSRPAIFSCGNGLRRSTHYEGIWQKHGVVAPNGPTRGYKGAICIRRSPTSFLRPSIFRQTKNANSIALPRGGRKFTTFEILSAPTVKLKERAGINNNTHPIHNILDVLRPSCILVSQKYISIIIIIIPVYKYTRPGIFTVNTR